MNPQSDEYDKWGSLKTALEVRGATVELTDNLDAAIAEVKTSDHPHDHVISGTFDNWDKFRYEPLIAAVNTRNKSAGEKSLTRFTLLTGYLTEKRWGQLAQERGWGPNFSIQLKNEYREGEFMARLGLPPDASYPPRQEIRY